MQVYRDRGFCGSDCVNRSCDRNITPEIRADAVRVGRPFDLYDFKTGCEDYTPPAASARTG